MPSDQRPQYFAIFPNWFNFPEGIFLQPLHRIRVFEAVDYRCGEGVVSGELGR